MRSNAVVTLVAFYKSLLHLIRSDVPNLTGFLSRWNKLRHRNMNYHERNLLTLLTLVAFSLSRRGRPWEKLVVFNQLFYTFWIGLGTTFFVWDVTNPQDCCDSTPCLQTKLYKFVFFAIDASRWWTAFSQYGAIQVLRNADGVGGGVNFFGKKHYEGVRFNVISVTRGWVGVHIPGKKHYVTLERPLYEKCRESGVIKVVL